MANGTQTSSIEGGKWLQLYKPTQGYWTRMLTAVGAGALILWGASWIFIKLSVIDNPEYRVLFQAGGATIYILVLGILLFWMVGKNATTVDFLISVEGEMKKVNWSSWPEVIGSTKVVILFVALLSIMLFVVDTVFMLFFSDIGVLKGPGFASVLESVGNYISGLFGSK